MGKKKSDSKSKESKREQEQIQEQAQEQTQEQQQQESREHIDKKAITSRLVQMFRNPQPQRAIDKIVSSFIDIGLSKLKIDFIRDVAFGWVEEYLNGAVCPKCHGYLGKASEVPDFTFCTNCGEKISPIKVTPLRLYLALANDADIFEIVPDDIKQEPTMLLKGSIGKSALRVYDDLSIEVILEPLLSWLKDNRPDLYYTVLTFPQVPEGIQILYELKMDRMSEDDIMNLAKRLGIDKEIENMSYEQKRDIMIKVITDAFDYKIDEDGISTLGVKKFVTMVETIKFKSREILVKVVGE